MSGLGGSVSSGQAVAQEPAHGDLNRREVPRNGNPSRRRILRWGLLATLLAVALVVAIREAPRELARWQMAAAVEHQRNGDLDAALAAMDSAIERDSRSADLFRRRSQLRLEAALLEGNPDNERHAREASLADIDRAIELAGEKRQYLLQRSIILQHLGRHEEAVADWHAIVRIDARQPFWLQMLHESNEQLYSAYNGRAYARALGDMEHDEAMAEIEAALDFQPDDPMWLDTRGFLHWQQAKRHAELAQQHARQAKEFREQAEEHRKQAEKHGEQAATHARNAGMHAQQSELELQQNELRLEEEERRLQQQQLTAQDEDLVHEKSERQLQRDELRRQASELREAMIDLNTAVRGAEWQYAQWDVIVQRDKWAITDPRTIDGQRKDRERSVAVIRYHRALVWQTLNAEHYAERDLRRVRELGFVPGDDLF
jgi:hypothetical protein